MGTALVSSPYTSVSTDSVIEVLVMQRGSFLAYSVGLSAALMITRRRATEELKRTKLKSVALEIKGNACACTLASC